jgi:pyridoxamine 5'-phosphate oxidase
MSDDIRKFINQDRRDFEHEGVLLADFKAHPVAQFESWMQEAKEAKVLDPYAMCLSTIGLDGFPKSRMVYLRDLIEGSFVFYTNYSSHKGAELDARAEAALNFHWSTQDRQVRVEGIVKRVSEEVSDAYFKQRPRMSQLGAWASEQSTVIRGREDLKSRLAEVTKKFEGKEVSRPPFWGGYALTPVRFEFFQGRKSRLHDRIVYQHSADEWKLSRVSP